MPTKTKAQKKSNRIVAFDVLRGFFLVVILINHIELYPNGFDYFTGRGRLFVSAAEGFFFMSGLLIGLVYRRRLHLGMFFIFKKMWTRALELYLGSVILSLLFTAVAIWLNHPNIKYGLPALPIDWMHTVKEALLMRYGFGWADFLDRFAILMFLAPFGFYMLAKRKWALLALVSFTAWLFRGQSFTLAWQAIFALGMVLGFYWNQLTNRWNKLSATSQHKIRVSVASLAIISFVASYLSVYVLSVLNEKINALSHGWQQFTYHWNSANDWVWQFAQKWTMGPLRIVLFLLWFFTMFMWVQRHYKLINKYTLGVIEMFGQNSLFVYIAHAFIVFIFKFFIPPTTYFWENFLFTAGAIAALIGVTYAYKKYHPTLRAKKTHYYQKLPWIPANVES